MCRVVMVTVVYGGEELEAVKVLVKVDEFCMFRMCLLWGAEVSWGGVVGYGKSAHHLAAPTPLLACCQCPRLRSLASRMRPPPPMT